MFLFYNLLICSFSCLVLNSVLGVTTDKPRALGPWRRPRARNMQVEIKTSGQADGLFTFQGSGGMSKVYLGAQVKRQATVVFWAWPCSVKNQNRFDRRKSLKVSGEKIKVGMVARRVENPGIGCRSGQAPLCLIYFFYGSSVVNGCGPCSCWHRERRREKSGPSL